MKWIWVLIGLLAFTGRMGLVKFFLNKWDLYKVRLPVWNIASHFIVA